MMAAPLGQESEGFLPEWGYDESNWCLIPDGKFFHILARPTLSFLTVCSLETEFQESLPGNMKRL